MIFQLTLANGRVHNIRGADLIAVLRQLAHDHGIAHPIINISIVLEAGDGN